MLFRSEILRGLADKLEGGQDRIPHQDQSAQLHQVEPANDEQSDINTMPMVGPLQQKLELLKKAVDVDNYYDDGSEVSQTKSSPVNLTLNVPQGQSSTKIELTINGQQVDELDQIKQLAGVPVASIFDAGDDEPLDS